ncbi:Protein-disulfide isomerase [Candidatus Terasakiella magnetica]|nr:Protein-disulfide isomerase [Candidatus Terasakiella magnetica]
MIAKTLTAAFALTGLLLAATPAAAQDAPPLSPKQAEAVKKIVRDYLMEHPEVLGEALEALREKMRVQAEADAHKMLEARKDEILKNADDPQGGNLKGDVTVVEFFDYNCGFCRQTFDPMWDAVKADGKTRVVMKEFPVLGPDSVIAARVALVAKAQSQAKYDEIHRGMMKYRGRLNEEAIFRIARDAGFNVDQLKKDIDGADITRQLKKNAELAHSLEIGATPTFIIGDRIIASALDQSTVKQLIEAARKAPAAKN